MTKQRVLAAVAGILCWAGQALAQQMVVTGKVTNEVDAPMAGVSVIIKGTTLGTQTLANGTYSLRATPGQTLVYRFIGHAPQERVVGDQPVINIQLRRAATNLDAMVVTALGQTTQQRNLGTAQQVVSGEDIAGTTRQNFINSLQGRVAGVEVASSSGVPGASSSITIRGVSSISSNNQPLVVIDGLPMDNKTLGTGVLASDAPGSTTAFNNRGLDFTNRAADINPEDIESVVILKGPEASALYGIDAANGAIVITTKTGRPGRGGFTYSNTFRIETPRAEPVVQRKYGPTTVVGDVLGSFQYFGSPYADTTTFYNNVDGFFRTALTQRHNLAFDGATADNRINYRISTGLDDQQGVIPNANYGRITVTGRSQATVTDWLKTDLSMNYSFADNQQTFKGDGGPLIGLLVWPQTDDAKDYLSPAGTRRRITGLAANAEVDNPYFNVNKNRISSRNNRLIANLGLNVLPFSWGSIRSNIGLDSYTNENNILRHPESAFGLNNNGILDVATDIVRNITSQTLFNVNRRTLWRSLSASGMVGHVLQDQKSNAVAANGRNFLDPNFVSLNNTDIAQRFNRTTIAQRRVVSVLGQASFDWKNYLFLNITGRNDWTSTIPEDRRSFFYPSVSSSFIFSDAFPVVAKYVTGKLRASYAEVGKDARPYAFRPALESKTTTFGGYGYGFTGPNLNLSPEFARSYEFGGEFGFLQDRLGLDVTVYRKQTKDQIVNDIRSSYGTGFILLNLNGAETRNTGLEVTLRGTPLLTRDFSWDVVANFERARGEVLALPNALPESYVSDTWLYGNVRNGTAPGLSTRSLTGLYYLRNNQGEILIDPTTGLPIRSTTFIDAGYDRQPDWTLGVQNNLKYRRFTVSFLVDFRVGGDVFNGTEHFLTTRGLSMRTLDREEPRVVRGVLRDGKENTATPTRNTIQVIPQVQPLFYTGMSEELFIEKDINWIRLRDITVRYALPGKFMNARDVSVYMTATDLWMTSNYSGLDPIVNGNSAAVGGSGGVGIDYGNFPIPRGIAFGLTVGF